ncbi:MAG: LruC domain-containing protein [Bacteroidales bacterium]
MVFFALVSIISCKKRPEKKIINQGNSINNIKVPKGFDFSNTKTLDFTIQGDPSGAVYELFAVSKWDKANDAAHLMNSEKRKLYTLRSIEQQNNMRVCVPKHFKHIMLVRYSPKGFQERFFFDIDDSTIQFDYTPKNQRQSRSEELLYGVNANKEFFLFDLNDMSVEELPTIPCSSIACTVNPFSGEVYIANNLPPYDLYAYEPVSKEFEKLDNFDFIFPRMGYNGFEDLLYFGSNNNYLYAYDVDQKLVVDTYQITGLPLGGGGDLCFDDSGQMYLVDRYNVYRVDIENNSAVASKINTQNMPLGILTSIGIDKSGYAYISEMVNNGKIIKFNIEDGTWEYVEISNTESIANQINDFGMFITPDLLDPEGDNDNDGVINSLDAYPQDASKAFKNSYVDSGETATLAFEDLWNSKGDYDFNDLVINYNYSTILSPNNKIVQLDIITTVKHLGGSLHNGFAIELPVAPSFIGSVNGGLKNSGLINYESNGIEADQQDKSVVVVFEDDRVTEGKTYVVSVMFNSPLDIGGFDYSQFNPFIFLTESRGVEIHLPNYMMTNLGNTGLLGVKDDASNLEQNITYLSHDNLPWAINVMYDLELVQEKIPITEAYLKFRAWAQSGGTVYDDWYMNIDGYRNTGFIMVE